MAAQINYEDNLYYLTISLRHLKNGISLDIDPDFFMKKAVDDILFHHDILCKLYGHLAKNPHLIQRMELLRLVLIAKKEFNNFIDSLEGMDSQFARELMAFQPQFSQCHSRNEDDIIEISSILEGPSEVNAETGDIITQDEYRFLFLAEQE